LGWAKLNFNDKSGSCVTDDFIL